MPGSPAGAPGGNGRAAEEPTAAPGAGRDSLLHEVQAAADAAIAHVRAVAATAAAEARLSAASAAALAASVVAALALVLVAWICLLALGVWLLVQAGAPVWTALAGAVLVNLVGLVILRAWAARLAPNLSFTRTRRLLQGRDAAGSSREAR